MKDGLKKLADAFQKPEELKEGFDVYHEFLALKKDTNVDISSIPYTLLEEYIELAYQAFSANQERLILNQNIESNLFSEAKKEDFMATLIQLEEYSDSVFKLGTNRNDWFLSIVNERVDLNAPVLEPVLEEEKEEILKVEEDIMSKKKKNKPNLVRLDEEVVTTKKVTEVKSEEITTDIKSHFENLLIELTSDDVSSDVLTQIEELKNKENRLMQEVIPKLTELNKIKEQIALLKGGK